jgi:hypothetical protein
MWGGLSAESTHSHLALTLNRLDHQAVVPSATEQSPLATRPNNRNIAANWLSSWLSRQGVSSPLFTNALRILDPAAALGDKPLYDANKAVYSLLR